jgi:exonuclease VII large subunit
MENIKYTTDNKKVIVVGKLNAQDTIVQEIFISNGSEIPSGENFVVKSLHDTPVISWKEKTLKELEERYELNKKKYESLISEQIKKNDNISKRLKAIYSNQIKVCESLEQNKELGLLGDFMAGNIKWILKVGYSLEMIEWDKIDSMKDDWGQFEALKLVSLFGRTDGSFMYKLSNYSDGSGRSDEIEIFKDYESCLARLKEKILSKEKYNPYDLEASNKYGFQLDETKLNAYKGELIKQIEKSIDAKKEELNKLELQLKSI